jgi:hypothetical protein
MARIKYASIVSGVSGSVGSATFQKSLYGDVLRNRPRSGNYLTPSRQIIKMYMTQCQYEWQALNPAQRRQWNQYIAFSGATIKRDRSILLTGHSLFIKYNFLRLLQELSVLTDPAYISSPEWPSLVYLKYNSGNLQAQFSGDLVALGIYVTLFLSFKRKTSQSYSPVGLKCMYPLYMSTNTCGYDSLYVQAFGSRYALYDTIHYRYRLWSGSAPILSPVITGIKTVTA